MRQVICASIYYNIEGHVVHFKTYFYLLILITIFTWLGEYLFSSI